MSKMMENRKRICLGFESRWCSVMNLPCLKRQTMIYGTFLQSKDDKGSHDLPRINLKLGAIAAIVVSLVFVVYSASKPSTSSLSEIDREDGTTALVNAVLVARADKISTREASDLLGIDPKLPFLGANAYASHGRHSSKSSPMILTQTQRTQKLWMPKQENIQKAQAFLQSLDLDPSTQFCSDPEDCLRNDDYFKQNALWHQGAHDMIMNPTGPALPPNRPGMAWCDRDVDPSC